MLEDEDKSLWSMKGASMSDKSARTEFGLTQDEIVAAIRAGKLQYRINVIYGNPSLLQVAAPRGRGSGQGEEWGQRVAGEKTPEGTGRCQKGVAKAENSDDPSGAETKRAVGVAWEVTPTAPVFPFRPHGLGGAAGLIGFSRKPVRSRTMRPASASERMKTSLRSFSGSRA